MRLRSPVIALVGSALLAGCGGFESSSGVMTRESDLRRLEPGQSRKEDVAALLGGPSVVGTFDDNRWYYVGQRTERFAFLDPEVTEHKVVVVEFQDDGYLRRVRTLNEDDRREITPVGRETPTAGEELTFIQQLFGNLGRFNEGGGGN